MKTLPARAWLLHAGRRTDVKKLIVVFTKFGNAHKNCYCIKENRVSVTKVIYFCTGKYWLLILKIRMKLVEFTLGEVR